MAARLNSIARQIVPPASRSVSAAATRTRIQQDSFTSISTNTNTVRMSSSSAPRTYEWLVVVPDKPGTMEKRLEVRPQHFEGVTKMKETGAFKMGGAVLEEMPADDEVSSMKFAGSTLMVVAESRQAVIDMIKDDVYVRSGVWDLEKAMIWPAKIAFRVP
ncbi:hypothetical protein VSDG_07416 [Cytospora chrysosperma]|uniref:YCII-related domain-containing protein n=1 Tax=Cytospora chrysosperma TaxID=252740 RepID=A0A423VI76_CYTCH|nr:hypothetical protein VSDG_07416 [Valsa sordida]